MIPGITGLTTAQLQSGLPAGFDPSIWAESPNINGGLPYLITNPPAALGKSSRPDGRRLETSRRCLSVEALVATVAGPFCRQARGIRG